LDIPTEGFIGARDSGPLFLPGRPMASFAVFPATSNSRVGRKTDHKRDGRIRASTLAERLGLPRDLPVAERRPKLVRVESDGAWPFDGFMG